MIDARSAIGLVAGRELRTRIRSKAFLIVLAVTAVAFLALPLVLNLINTGPHTDKVAVTDAAFGRSLERVASALNGHVKVTTYPDAAAARAAVSAKMADAYAVPGATGIRATVKDTLPDGLRALFSSVQQQHALGAQITGLGGDPAKVAAALAAVHLDVVTLHPPDPQRGQKIAVAIAAGLLMYMILMTVGQMVAQGVVEEKSSRVVELLLVTVKPWQLMAGKILGIGLLGILQLIVPAILGVGAGMATGQLDVSLGSAISTLVWSLAWFVCGFALYAMLFAAVGAMVSRQEDLSGLMVPLMMPLVIAWVVGISVLPSDPGNAAGAVLSFVPLLAPVLMPMRWALGVAPFWQVLVALVLTIALSVVMLRVAGRIYRNSVLRSGARVPWRDALKAA